MECNNLIIACDLRLTGQHNLGAEYNNVGIWHVAGHTDGRNRIANVGQ